jgi:chromosome segregation ATPase
MSDTKLDDAARKFGHVKREDDVEYYDEDRRDGFMAGARWALAELETELAKEREYSAETHARFEEQLERIKELEARHFNGNADLVVKCDRLTARIQELEAEVERLKPKPRMSDPDISNPDEKLSRAVLRIKQLEAENSQLKHQLQGFDSELDYQERIRELEKLLYDTAVIYRESESSRYDLSVKVRELEFEAVNYRRTIIRQVAEVERLKSCNQKQMEAISGYEAQLEATERERDEYAHGAEIEAKLRDEMMAERDRYKSALWKIAEAEHMGYGTQRTYGEMAKRALEGDGE